MAVPVCSGFWQQPPTRNNRDRYRHGALPRCRPVRETLPWGGHHIFDRVVARRLQRFYDRITKRRPTARRILDVGCGPGHLAAALAHTHPEAQVRGIDMDPVQVRLARRHAADNLRYDVGASHALPVEDGAVDWVLATETFHHWSRPDDSLHELRRVLAPGGEAWIIEGAGDMTRDEFIAWTGKRPFPLLMPWVRWVFSNHGYVEADLQRDVLEPARRVFAEVNHEREDGWWIVTLS